MSVCNGDNLWGRIGAFESLGAADGPGVRFVIFMQGCPLRCAYCHNPDMWDFGGGAVYTPRDVLTRVRRFYPYIKKNGGVTVSGGEPLMQPEFVRELFRLLREDGVHTALDTSGTGDIDAARGVLRYTDLVLLDVKFSSEEEYRHRCGGGYREMTAFLELIRDTATPYRVRRVVIPGINDGGDEAERLARLLRNYPQPERVEFLPFRKLCAEKYENLGIPFPLAGVPEAGADLIKRMYGEYGNVV